MIPSAALFERPQMPPPRHLLQFKAGKMTQGSDNWVHADPRKGWVYVYQSGDGRLHFTWIDRKTCLVEDDFVIAPKQAEFKKVVQCTTGRVYLLKLKDSKRFFIWMQEPNAKKDDNICTRINDYIEFLPAQSSTPGDWLTSFGGLNQLTNSDILALLSMGVGLGSGVSSESDVSSAQATAETIGRHLNTSHLSNQQNPASILGSSTGTAAAGTTSGTSTTEKRPEGGKIQLQDLRNILSSVTASKEASIDLNSAINVDSLRNLLEKPEVQERLKPHLPPVDPEAKPDNDLDNLTTNIRSAQFKSTLKSFSAAFQTGDLAPLLAQFKLGAKADEAARRGDLVAFSQALQTASTSKVTGSTSTKPDEAAKKDEDKNKQLGDSSPDKKGRDGTAMDTD
ncbi:Adhesion regulating molecule 1 [Fasciolopsis buskii]|uniref:Adhesion regulating molecule 1 n=1 Tax=Fasciolopsis buskii TaxID=27845 RepID=A0A8E0VG65_9TREM|nr:Adhesion regulating molecule 1 [Fasciolopsis buski]